MEGADEHRTKCVGQFLIRRVMNDLTKVRAKLPPAETNVSRSITDASNRLHHHLGHWSSQGCIEPPRERARKRESDRERERERERVGNRAINNYRMKKGARYPPGAPKPRLHTPRRPLPPLVRAASYKPRTGRPRQLYPRTRNVLLP